MSEPGMFRRLLARIRGSHMAKLAGIIVSGLLLGFAGASVYRKRKKAEALQGLALKNAAEGATGAQGEAAKQQKTADKHARAAQAAAEQAQKRIDELGASDESLADLLSRYNSEPNRMRHG